MKYIKNEQDCPEGWEALPLPDGRLICVDPESDEFEKLAEAYVKALAGDMDEFYEILRK